MVPSSEKPILLLSRLLILVKNSTGSILDFIKANEFGFLRDLRLLFSARALKNAIDEIDRSTMALQRVTTLLALRRPAPPSCIFQRAIQLAKRLRFTRGFASNLHPALLQGRRRDCHDRHIINLRLNDRVQLAAVDAQSQEDSGFVPGLAFQILLAELSNRQQRSCHEISVHVLNTGD